MRAILLIFTLVLSLSGCFEVDQTITVGLDGSGQTELRYALPLSLLGQISLGDTGGALPLTREQLQDTLGNKEGLEIVGGSFQEKENLKIVHAVIKFEQPKYLTTPGIKYSWFTEGDEQVFRVFLDRRPSNKKLADLHKLLVKSFDKNGYTLTVNLPRRISWSNAEKYDGNSARWFIPAGWLLDPSAKPRTLEARFKISTTERVKAWFMELFD